MESFINFFETMSSGQKLAWILICLSFTWVLEAGIPLVRFNYQKLKHIGVNLIFLATSLAVNVLFGLATLGLITWAAGNEFGLLNWISIPLWAELLVGIMLLDLVAQYWAHYMLHRVKWMWKLHIVHHSDTTVDATTGTRHHPGDYFVREVFSLGAILVGGIPLAIYLMYRVITIFFAYWSHANINLPRWFDKPMSYILITPNMHKFHHHFERPWTDSNFGNIFSFWDRMFGTLVYDDPKKVKYGLDIHPEGKDQNIGYQFYVPFDKSIETDY